ncbi:MAG: AbrB/MazE/SpoVT family DNA-binding domain-containing protein [Prosthecobacter sp.]
MQAELREIGDAVALILPKEALGHLGSQAGDSIELTYAAGGKLELSSVHDDVVDRQMVIARDIMKRYHNTLRELAK